MGFSSFYILCSSGADNLGMLGQAQHAQCCLKKGFWWISDHFSGVQHAQWFLETDISIINLEDQTGLIFINIDLYIVKEKWLNCDIQKGLLSWLVESFVSTLDLSDLGLD